MFNRNLRKTFFFMFFSLLFSAGALGLLYLAGAKMPATVEDMLLLLAAYSFGPLLSVFLVEKVIYKEDLLPVLGLNFKFNVPLIFAFVIPLAIVFGAFGVGLLMPGTSYTPNLMGEIQRQFGEVNQEAFLLLQKQIAGSLLHPVWQDVIMGIVAGATIVAAVAFLSVSSFAGFLFKELHYLKFWNAAYLTGILAAIWLTPLLYVIHLYSGYPVTNLALICMSVIMAAPILIFLKIKAKNIFVPSIAAGVLYWSSPVAVKMIFGGNILHIGVAGLAGIIAIAVITLLVFLYNRFMTQSIERIY